MGQARKIDLPPAIRKAGSFHRIPPHDPVAAGIDGILQRAREDVARERTTAAPEGRALSRARAAVARQTRLVRALLPVVTTSTISRRTR